MAQDADVDAQNAELDRIRDAQEEEMEKEEEEEDKKEADEYEEDDTQARAEAAQEVRNQGTEEATTPAAVVDIAAGFSKMAMMPGPITRSKAKHGGHQMVETVTFTSAA